MCEERRTEFALDGFTARRRGRPGPCRPAEARRAVERAVTERCRATGTRCAAEALADALLVASELTTNAILHGGGITDFAVDVVGLGGLGKGRLAPAPPGTAPVPPAAAERPVPPSARSRDAGPPRYEGGVPPRGAPRRPPPTPWPGRAWHRTALPGTRLGVRVSVSDRSDRPPVVAPPTDPQGRRRVGGHGWPIVCRLACDLRVTDLPSGGKRITAVVPLF